jgi:hypothetical protein
LIICVYLYNLVRLGQPLIRLRISSEQIKSSFLHLKYPVLCFRTQTQTSTFLIIWHTVPNFDRLIEVRSLPELSMHSRQNKNSFISSNSFTFRTFQKEITRINKTLLRMLVVLCFYVEAKGSRTRIFLRMSTSSLFQTACCLKCFIFFSNVANIILITRNIIESSLEYLILVRFPHAGRQ